VGQVSVVPAAGQPAYWLIIEQLKNGFAQGHPGEHGTGAAGAGYRGYILGVSFFLLVI
jgi:hypothetical protein